MSNFHSTISRREFMKVIGLSGAAVGAASLTTPVFHDLDELKSADLPGSHSAWWVKEVDQPTVPIDWSKVSPSNSKINGHLGIPYTPWPGQKVMAYINAVSAPKGNPVTVPDSAFGISKPAGGWPKYVAPVRQMAIDYIKSKYPDWQGDSLMDTVIGNIIGPTASTPTFVAPQTTPRYDVLGYPKYQGTPEENYVMIRNLAKVFGAQKLAVMGIDANTRRLFWDSSPRGVGTQDVAFEDVPLAYQTATKVAVPNKNEYVITVASLLPTVIAKRKPATIEGLHPESTFLNYGLTLIQNFIWGLGYESNYTGDMMNFHPANVVSGGGEHTRMTGSLHPMLGAMNAGQGPLITDLPLAITKAVDAGVFRFCKTCGICAENCPPGSIWKNDPSWDHTVIPGSPPGYEGYRMDSRACVHCRICQAVCPFNAPRDSWLHYFVAGTTAMTPVFNKFFSSMERTFGYSKIWHPEGFWTEEEFPMFGYLGNQLQF